MLLTKMSSARGSFFAAGETRGFKGLTFHPCSFIGVPRSAAPAATASEITVYILDHPAPVKHAICKEILTLPSLGDCQAASRRVLAPRRRRTALLIYSSPVAREAGHEKGGHRQRLQDTRRQVSGQPQDAPGDRARSHGGSRGDTQSRYSPGR